MDNNTAFRKNLVNRRKELGLTQEQLAQKMNVSPQAVSKWENTSYPDGSLLPLLSETLNISLDELFGLKKRSDKVDIEQMITDEIRCTKPEERSKLVMKMYYAAVCAFNDYIPQKTRLPEHLERETFAELRTDSEMSIARLNEDLQYFCFLSIPEKGINSYVDSSLNMVRLFEMLADKDALDIIFYLGSGIRNRMHSVKVVAKRLEISEEKVQHIIDELDRFGLVWRVSAEITDEPMILYGFTHSTPLTILLSLAKSLTNYIQFCEPFIDRWGKGAYRMPDKSNVEPIPQISHWDNEEQSK